VLRRLGMPPRYPDWSIEVLAIGGVGRRRPRPQLSNAVLPLQMTQSSTSLLLLLLLLLLQSIASSISLTPVFSTCANQFLQIHTTINYCSAALQRLLRTHGPTSVAIGLGVCIRFFLMLQATSLARFFERADEQGQ
jgi:hypothetical protein